MTAPLLSDLDFHLYALPFDERAEWLEEVKEWVGNRLEQHHDTEPDAPAIAKDFELRTT